MRALVVVLAVFLAGCAAAPEAPLDAPAPAPSRVDVRNVTLEWDMAGDLSFAVDVRGQGTCRIDWAAAGPSEGLPPGIAYLVHQDGPAGEAITFGSTDGNGNTLAGPEAAVHAGPQTVEQRNPPEGRPWAARRVFDLVASDGNATLVLGATAIGPHEPVELGTQQSSDPTITLNATARLSIACPPTAQATLRAATLALYDSSQLSGGAGLHASAFLDVATVSAQNRVAMAAAGDGIAAAFIGIDPEKDGRLTLDAPTQDFEWVFVPTHVLDVVPTPGYVGTRQGPCEYTFTLDMVGGPVFGVLDFALADIQAAISIEELPGGPAVA